MKFCLQTFDLNADEFIISMNARINRSPPRRDENSDLLPFPFITFYRPFDLTSSGNYYPATTLLKDSCIDYSN
jgi:hypothetical protein